MRIGISRFVIAAAVAGLAAIAGSTTAWAQSTPCPASPNYVSNFSANAPCVTRNLNAVFVSNALQLTASAGNQVGSAWYSLKQPVQNGFSTTFQFQFTNPSAPPADGIAFVIQNSSSGAGAVGFAGGNGGALAYGDSDASVDPSSGAGIKNSLAVEFDTFQNGWDPAGSHVAVQSCGTGANTSHHSQLCSGTSGSNSTLGAPVSVASLADGAVHKVTITYAAPCLNCATPTTSGNLHVILDNVDLYSSGITVDLSSLGLDGGGNAFVGFTGATGGDFETQSILNWTLTVQSQSAVATQGTNAVVPFQGDAFNYAAQLNTGNPTTFTVNPILMDQGDCNTLIQPNFPGAKCFVYKDAGGTGVDKSVLLELTCPQLPSNPECNPFDAELGSNFDLSITDPNFNPSSPPLNPMPGWLKGHGPISGHPCTASSGNSPALFQSNQVESFAITRIDPVTKGRSGGTGSCWVATYNTPLEAPSVSVVAPINGGTYQLNQNDATTKANYVCHTVNNSGATGPYLTPTSCTATDTPGGSVANGAQFDTATAGLHTFTANVVDSGTDSASQAVTYNVVGPTDLAILKVGNFSVNPGGKITYTIGVGDLGPSNGANVIVVDTLPLDTTLVSASGKNIVCSIVNKKLSCPTTPITCTGTSVVSCAVGTIMPLSLSSLNGATIQIVVQLGHSWTPKMVVKNTATVSGTNVETKTNNNSSTASTQVVVPR
jgi:uncharacterized repeat protein (TIGR01451 family)